MLNFTSPSPSDEYCSLKILEENKKYYILNAISDFIWLGRTSPPFVFGNSSYRFHENSATQKLNWAESRQRCKDTGSDLVSIESKNERRFLKNTIQKINTVEYYIGLKKESKSGEWKWLSDNSKVNATRGKFPWARGEPNGDGNCVVMFRHYLQNYGLFNDLSCDQQLMYSGYICESPTKSTDQEGMSYKILRLLLWHYWTVVFFFFSNGTL